MSEDILELPAPKADARISYGQDPNQVGDLRLPAGAGPHLTVLVIHGGYWRARYDLEHIGHLCAALTREGLATWSLEYRRLGQPGGGWPGTFQDVAAGADHLRTLAAAHQLDLGRVVAVGHSAGGHLALWLAARGKIPSGDPLASPDPLRLRGAVSLAGVLDLRRAWELRLSGGVVGELLGGPPERFPERYATASPYELLPLGVPQVLLHGTEDHAVPYEISRRYHERAAELGDPASLVTLPGARHFEVIDPRSPEWPRVVQAVKSLLSVG
jgi:acetyl esterase/lipase